MNESTALILMIKNPIKGKVKTRLAADVGEDMALAIYRKLLEHTRKQAQAFDAIRYVYYSWEVTTDDEWSPDLFQKRLQADGDLGNKMEKAFTEVLEQHDKALIIGSDCGELRTHHLEAAMALLDSSDVVLGPARDGGYYLMGLKQNHPNLFREMVWSTDQVLDNTLNRIGELGWNAQILETLSDVDFVADWERVKTKMD